jgi:hypothetical protein
VAHDELGCMGVFDCVELEYNLVSARGSAEPMAVGGQAVFRKRPAPATQGVTQAYGYSVGQI